MSNADSVVPERVARKIVPLRGINVMLDRDLAELYGVQTKVLNQAVRRNRGRFPADFVFQLTEEEKAEVVTNCDHLLPLKYSPVLPLAFTEHGAVMAASVLNSAQAVAVSVMVVRAFVALKGMLTSHREVAGKLNEIERRLASHDRSIRMLFAAIRQLIAPGRPKPARIGFRTRDDDSDS